MLPHCTVHMLLLKTISLHFSRMKLNGCRFWDGSVAFQRLAHFTTSKPPTGILWYATFDIPTFRCGMPRVLKNCESHSLTLPFLRRATRVMWALESQISEHRLYLQCSCVNIWPSSWLQWPRGIPRVARFPWKNIRGPSTVGRITCELVNPRPFYVRKHKESEPKECGRIPARRIFCGKRQGMWKRSTASHVNLQSHWSQDAFYLRKHKESGRVAATRVFLEKRYGILGSRRERRVNLQSHWTQDAFYLRKHEESRGAGTTRIFVEKHKGLAGSVMRDI